MKMKKFLASVLAALMAVSSMSFIASAQETDDSAEVAAETVTITFNAQNGAKDKAVTTADVAVGEAVPFPADPTYIYHTFKGWSTEKNGTVIDDLSAVTATEAVTYYGVWEWSKPDDGTPLDSITRAKNENIANENALDGGTWYDAVAGVVYKRIKPKTVGSTGSANMYSSLNYSIPGTELYMVALVRTNMTNANSVSAGVYQTTNKDGAGVSFPALSGTPVTEKDTWQKVILKNTNLQNFGVGIHIDYDLAGNDPADDLENDYYDMAGMALFANEADAKAWDIYAQNAYAGDAVISFDAHLTEDDDTDVYTEYPTNLENEGNALVGWTLDPTAEEIEYVDITRLPIPTENATYHAVWNEERTINFYKNDGTDAVETLTLGKGAAVEAPEFTAEGKKFLGWAETADGEIVEIQKTAEENKDYYAIWLNNWLTEVVVNSNDYSPSTKNGSWYGIEDLATAERLDFVMPYGYPTSIVPTIVPKAANGEAVYNAPATFDDEGSIVMGDITIPVTFTVADKDSVKDMTIVPTDTVNAGGRGAKPFKNNEDKGISALKVVPIYTNESDYYEAGKFQPDKVTGVEGWGTFATHNIESYSQYRALVYYDDGGDGIDIDTSKNPAYIGISGAHTRGTFKGVNIYASNQYKTNRWEYVYFNIPDDKYGMTLQLSYNFFCGKTANSFKNDVLYVAEVSALVDADEKYLQYVPMGLDSTNETNAKNDGTITGVTADMEIAIGDSDEYTAVADFDGYDAETGVIAGLAPATYYVRYTGDDNYAPSEDVELVITPDSVEIYFEDGDPATNVIEQSYAYDAVITAPDAPEKAGFKFIGWALEDAEEAYDFTDVVADAELDGATFNALWERVTTFYVNGSVPTAGDGASAEAPLTSLADAWALVSDTDATIVITGNTDLKGNFHANGGNVTIKGATGEEVLTHAGPSFNGTNPGKITFENLTIVNPTQWSNFWNFYGMEVEFGENITVPVDTANGKWGIVARAGGESGATLGRKIVLKSGEFSTFHLGSKGNVVNADVDFEFLGGKATINLGNDSVANQQVTTHGGTMQNIKALFDVQPKSVYMQWIHTMTGALQVIANNGVNLGAINMNGVVPAGGTYIIHSAEGGRVDFTDTIGTYKFTTDKTYIVITDAEGNSTKYRAADGVTGDANLYADETTLELALDAGRYNVTYTDEGVSVKVHFYDYVVGHNFELNAANNYSVTISETIIANAQSKARDGYKFSGEFTSLDGTYKTVNGTLTVTEYTDEKITLFPEYVEDDTLPYYHAKAIYNEKLGTIDVTVSIANGKFEAGTVGGIFEKNLFEFAGYELAEGISNNIGDAPAIVKEAMYDGEDNKFVLVWDAAEGYVDATEEDVDIVTFHFNVIEGHIVDIENIGNHIDFYHPQTNYEEYFMDGHYLASAVLGDNDDPFAVNYVPVYEGIVIGELAPTDPATVYVTVNMPDKAGATVDDIAYLAYWKNASDEVNFIALEEAGNEETTITKAITDVFYVGETYNFTVVKNGYTGSEEIKWTLVETQNFETTLLGGDIKESFTGNDANAVDTGDFGDGDVTLADFVRVVRAFDTEATDEYKAVVDINEDGDVNVTDLAIVKANFGKSYEHVLLYTSTNG